LRETRGWGPAPYQWATAGYLGAIETGKTICGFLVGSSIYLGYLSGEHSTDAPGAKDNQRKQAIASVRSLFKGFIEKFGSSDCQTLTGCDLSKKEDFKRYYKEEIYKDTCLHQFEYVLAHCLDQSDSSDR
jgi:hypothetical protein